MKQVGNTILAKGVNHILAKRDNSAWPKGAKLSGFSTYDGKPFNLEEWRGKYVLIDFWGTWCGACIAGMPEMKAFAAKHADKLMLLGIAQERDESTWRKYLSKSEWDWKQIISGEGDEDYILRFNVQGFPTKILIGPDGRILKRLVGEEPGFYVELEELMND